MRGAWIEIFLSKESASMNASLPVRGAWIEISYHIEYNVLHFVAPRAGSVD